MGVSVGVLGLGGLPNGEMARGKTLESRVVTAPVVCFSLFPPPGESFFICGDYRVAQIFLLSKHAGQMALGQWEGNIPQVLLFARKCRVREIKDSLDGSCFLSFSAGNSYNSLCIYAVDLKQKVMFIPPQFLRNQTYT